MSVTFMPTTLYVVGSIAFVAGAIAFCRWLGTRLAIKAGTAAEAEAATAARARDAYAMLLRVPLEPALARYRQRFDASRDQAERCGNAFLHFCALAAGEPAGARLALKECPVEDFRRAAAEVIPTYRGLCEAAGRTLAAGGKPSDRSHDRIIRRYLEIFGSLPPADLWAFDPDRFPQKPLTSPSAWGEGGEGGDSHGDLGPGDLGHGDLGHGDQGNGGGHSAGDGGGDGGGDSGGC
jgi:uncharacterized membrane protein YgcG